ncbi:hypothetical protein Taro_036575 [Colocasia esculenta]|uniref:FHA domain-containing protein n=1 Tax=Colocasia esculenta TaxID=4460 RepID=A0A843WGP7_COLES|nr:hypothetical protein [Colocasia esculenta]
MREQLAGASLESLAKGAVRFSRRFTIKELQDRWRSLLYDPEISAEASARMVNIEVEASISNHLKPGKTCNMRGKEWTPGKRKGDTVRSRYYAMRKRICNVPYNSGDPDFSVPPSTTADIDGEKSGNLHLDGNYMMGSSMSNQFRIPGSGFGIDHDTSQMLKDNPDAATFNAVEQDFSETHMDIVRNQISDEIVNSNGSFGFGGKIPPVSNDNGIGNNIVQSFEHKTAQTDDTHITGEDIKAFENNSDVQDIGSPQTMPARDPHETNNIETESFPTFCSENDNKELPCSGFGENQNLNPEVSDCSGSLHNIGFSSPLVSMSMWGGIDATPTLPMDASFDDNEQRSTPLTLPTDDVKKMIPPTYDSSGVEQKLHDGLSMDTLTDPSGLAEGDFVNLSLAFENDDELFLLNEDEKDIIDGSCLDTLDAILSDSPADIHHDNVYCSTDLYGSTDPKRLDVMNAHDVLLDDGCLEEPKDLGEKICSEFEDGHVLNDSLENVQEVPSKSLSPFEPLEGFIFCDLNTEDPEIPCNDDVILPNEVVPLLSSTDLKLDSEVTGNLPNNIISDDRRCMEEDDKTSVEHVMSSPNVLSPVLAKGGFHSDDCGIKTEFLEIESLSKGYRKPGVSSDGMNLLSSAPVAPLTVKEEVAALDPGKCGDFITSVDSFLEKSHGGSDHAKSNFHIRADVCEKVVNSASTIQKWMSSYGELGCRDTDPSQIASTSDQEEKSDSEDDIPNFSDIEAMILDMDLGLSDQEGSLFAREDDELVFWGLPFLLPQLMCYFNQLKIVHHELHSKAIMRLEQGAQSCMQRAIASHGAFAIFYGRRLKHYIKKAEVSLGRGTDDVYVDIDLRREGPANKISRHQAVVKMDEHGTFYLKNMGKCSILINGKEVLNGMQLNITSGCLIEIRGMKFVFEVNQNSVCQYLANVQRRSRQQQTQTSDWLPSRGCIS